MSTRALILIDAIVSILPAVGLDDAVPSEVLDRAKKFQGNPWEIGKLVRRHLARRVRPNAIG